MVVVEIVLLHRIDDHGVGTAFIDLMRTAHSAMFAWSVLTWMQLSRTLGHVVITVRQMSLDMFLFLVMLILFTVVLARLEMLFVNANSNEGCIDAVADVPTAIYSMLLTFLNMRHYTRYDVRSSVVLHVHHVAYVFVVGILLFHLLIAMFSNSVTRIVRNKETLVAQELLAVVGRYNALLFYLPIVGRFYRRLHTRQISRHFVCGSGGDDGRVYVVKMRSAVSRKDDATDCRRQHFAYCCCCCCKPASRG